MSGYELVPDGEDLILPTYEPFTPGDELDREAVSQMTTDFAKYGFSLEIVEDYETAQLVGCLSTVDESFAQKLEQAVRAGALSQNIFLEVLDSIACGDFEKNWSWLIKSPDFQ